MSEFSFQQLDESYLDQIIALEQESFIPPLQATREKILKRFDLGYFMYGILEKERLVGLISFSYTTFSPDDFDSFPKTFAELTVQSVPEQYNAVFVSSLGVSPTVRGRLYAKLLVSAAFDRAKQDGCQYGFANCRIPSYNGSQEFPQESIKQNPRFKAVIDNYLQNGVFPSHEEFLLDPLLALYYRLTGCRFLWIIPDYVPEDEPTGGIRVIAYDERQNWKSKSAETIQMHRDSAAPPTDRFIRK